jgi:hypothetical protein
MTHSDHALTQSVLRVQCEANDISIGLPTCIFFYCYFRVFAVHHCVLSFSVESCKTNAVYGNCNSIKEHVLGLLLFNGHIMVTLTFMTKPAVIFVLPMLWSEMNSHANLITLGIDQNIAHPFQIVICLSCFMLSDKNQNMSNTRL